MSLPEVFVWTRFGTEAGQSVEDIIKRKERERRDNNGVFLWGIGNNITPSIPALLRSRCRPEVAFSPIKSKPRAVDVEPGQVAVWSRATTSIGEHYDLPPASLVTSRYANGKSKHFALVCYSNRPLTQKSGCDALSIESIVNAKSGARIGYSQVTAVVRKGMSSCHAEKMYSVAMRCELLDPFVVTLHDPIVVSDSEDLCSSWSPIANKSPVEHEREPSQLSLHFV